MIKDTFFSMPRFVNLCRKDVVENWRSNVLRMALLYGIMTLVLLWVGYIEYNNKEVMVDKDSAWNFALALFMWSLWGFGCLSASLTLEKMKSKTGRLSVLMTPATSFEKYFSRWLVSVFLFLVVFLIAFRLADYTRVLVYTLVYPNLEEIAALPLSRFVGDSTGYYTLFRTATECTTAFALFFFTQSCFVLGSSIWPRSAFLKTFVAGAFIVAVYALLIVWMFELFDEGNSPSWMTQEVALTLSGIACFLLTLFNWTLAYFRFKESEIINRM